MAKRILVLGSTGSIGTQTLDVCSRLGSRIEVVGLAAHSNTDALMEQAARWNPEWLALTDGAETEAKLWTGPNAMERLAREADYDLMVVSVSGMVGLRPTLIALERGKEIALASKEVLVAGGAAVTEALKQGGKLLPIDSEHSAVFQCLQGIAREHVDEIILTASGGPFRGRTKEQLALVTAEQALAHPTWRMGPKITIDSATMMNKGLEVIEARWLFGLEPEQISVVIHPQSIVHSMVRTVDGSLLAQMGVPDMRLPIQVALLYPERLDTQLQRTELTTLAPLTFEEVDRQAFPCLDLAYSALAAGGTMPAALNGANEATVPMFLEGKIGFLDIPRIVEAVMRRHDPTDATLSAVLAADEWARTEAGRLAMGVA